MGRDLIYEKDNHICKDIRHCDVVFSISGPVLDCGIVNNISLKYMETFI